MGDKSEETSEPGISTMFEKDRRKYNLGICLFSVLNVLLIVLIAVSAHNAFSEKNVILLNHADICVPCEDLRLHPDDTKKGIEKRGKGDTICCVANEEDPNAIIGYYTDHWLKQKLTKDDRQLTRYKCDEKDNPEPLKPIIKLVGKLAKQPGEHHKIHWDGDHKMAIVPDDESITHHKEHGFIEIKKSGLYQVYSQIVLDHDTKAGYHHHGQDIYYHSVILIEAETTHYISPREITLLKVSNTHCVSKTSIQTIPSYLGGAFELSEGDKLAVKANNKTELVDVPHMNFFGAHMV